MISEALYHSHPPQTAFKLSHIPSGFLKPTIFLASKQNSTKPIFNHIKIPEQAKYFKKYFGHKVTFLKRSTQFVSVIHSRKLLQKISFDKGVCQKDGFRSSFDLILLGNDVSTSERSCKKVLKGFRGKLSLAFKGETNNIASDLKKNLTHLHGLEITLQKIEQFGFNSRAFDGLKSLQSFSLKFNPEFEKECGWERLKPLDFNPESYQQSPLSFLFLLLQKTYLKRLKLNLAPYPLSSFALSYLLLSIEQAKTPEWYVRSGMRPEALIEFTNGKDVQSSSNFPLYLTDSSEVIQKIDFFGLYVINHYLTEYFEEWHSDECGSKEFSPNLLSKIPQLTSKSCKVLDITLTKKLKKQIAIKTLLEKFSSLEGLYIKAPESTLVFEKKSDDSNRNDDYQRRNSDSEDDEERDFGDRIRDDEEEEMDFENQLEDDDDENFEYQSKKRRNLRNHSEDDERSSENESEDDPERESEKTQAKDFPWTKNLKQALLSIVSVNREYGRKDKPLKDLMKHLRDSCPTLESLNVFDASTAYENECGVVSRRESAVTIPCQSLTGFTSLQELEINSDEKGFEGVTETLRSLKNLRKIRLNFCDNARSFTLGERGRWSDGENIFDGLGQLKEFELYVRPDQSRCEEIQTPLYWVRYLTKNLHKLKNLEVLRVFDSKETQIEVEVILGLLKTLSQFTSLKEIVIHSNITLNAETLEMAACLYEEEVETVEERLIRFIKSKVNRIIDLNPNLRLVDIRSLENMKVDFIFYKVK